MVLRKMEGGLKYSLLMRQTRFVSVSLSIERVQNEEEKVNDKELARPVIPF